MGTETGRKDSLLVDTWIVPQDIYLITLTERPTKTTWQRQHGISYVPCRRKWKSLKCRIYQKGCKDNTKIPPGFEVENPGGIFFSCPKAKSLSKVSPLDEIRFCSFICGIHPLRNSTYSHFISSFSISAAGEILSKHSVEFSTHDDLEPGLIVRR